MDNLTHSLVGAALGRAGLYRRTRLAAGALIIGANLPDIDVIGMLFGRNLDFRRGITHGPVAMLVLPLLLTGALVLYDKMRPVPVGRDAREVIPGQLLALSYLAVLTHPFFDWLNSYGIRLLYPFSDRWFYGDGIFIVDPWLWLLLGGGVWLSRKRSRNDDGGSTLPARVALVVTALYIALMLAGSLLIRRSVTESQLASGQQVKAVMAAPVPVNPLLRTVIVHHDSSYAVGIASITASGSFRVEDTFASNENAREVARAVHAGTFNDFLYWSRFSVFRVRKHGDSVTVTAGDVRFPATGPMSGSFQRSVTMRRTDHDRD